MKASEVVFLVFSNLLFLLAITAQPIKSQSSENIYIMADGSVSPSTAPISQTGNIYTLTCNTKASITVDRNNITFDGDGHTITVPSIFSAGIKLNNVTKVTVKNFTITEGEFGIYVWGNFNVIANNTISKVSNDFYSIDQPTAGIFLAGSSNIITENSIIDDLVGINFANDLVLDGVPTNCSYNLVIGNNLTDCSTALLFYDSSNNSFYHNNFSGNEAIVKDTGYYGYGIVSLNIWDDGHLFGNYWSDYLTRYPNATEIDYTGIGDIDYVVRPYNYVDPPNVSSGARNYWIGLNALYAKNVDRYPLMQPFSNDFFVRASTPPKITLASPLNQTYDESNVPLAFSIDKPVNWVCYSLDGATNITTNGNITIHDMTHGLHIITVYVNDTYGNMGVSETIYFTIAQPSEPNPTTWIVVIIAVVVIVSTIGYLAYRRRK